ncbi:hypothetical protein GALMADRAFT_118835 [Galerina marginata CBS 339.88]|uniref:Nephrocystin 3-like N-terminal domain-containing protein n=1 Tax=Galerina marginata (strain CBS 339.88) TaxID=685588 RepID=A0A067TDL2_GALM3|nr:hypothetical protein GALMADRAFT_118835 [Galerina marginata CBS 339.88]
MKGRNVTVYSDFISRLSASGQHLFLLASTTARRPTLPKPTLSPMFTPNGPMVVTGGTFITQNNTAQLKKQHNRHRRTIRECFKGHVALNATHDTNSANNPRCHPGTRTAVLQTLEDWAQSRSTENSNPSHILWLFGPAQVGKSAIAGSFAAAQCKEGRLAASFFFPPDSRASINEDEREGLEKYLVPTIAFQMAFNIPELQPHIAQAVERNPIIFHQSAETQVEQLIITQVLSLGASPAFRFPRTIIIDGLDKCGDKDTQKRILCIIRDTAPRLVGRLKFLIVSRPEHHITTAFNLPFLNSITHSIDVMDHVNVFNDIRVFLKDGFEQIRATHALHRIKAGPFSPEEQFIELVVFQSGGNFGYARTAFAMSRPGRAINKVPILLFFLLT